MASTSFLSTALTHGACEHFVLELVAALTPGAREHLVLELVTALSSTGLTSATGPLQHRDLIKALGSQLSAALGRQIS